MNLTEEEREDIALALEAKADTQVYRVRQAKDNGLLSEQEASFARSRIAWRRNLASRVRAGERAEGGA